MLSPRRGLPRAAVYFPHGPMGPAKVEQRSPGPSRTSLGNEPWGVSAISREARPWPGLCVTTVSINCRTSRYSSGHCTVSILITGQRPAVRKKSSLSLAGLHPAYPVRHGRRVLHCAACLALRHPALWSSMYRRAQSSKVTDCAASSLAVRRCWWRASMGSMPSRRNFRQLSASRRASAKDTLG